MPLLLLNKNRRYRDTVATITVPDGTIKTKWLPSLKEAGQMLLTFALAVFGWIIFRAQDISQFGEVISTICSGSLFAIPFLKTRSFYIPLFINIMILLGVEWQNRTESHGLTKISDKCYIRYIIYYILIFIMIYAQPTSDATFIYFQF